jgi:1-acyl-sn-glycerol-3-phosphate acyltransferase
MFFFIRHSSFVIRQSSIVNRQLIMLDLGSDSLFVTLFRGSLVLLMRLLFRIEHRGTENIPRNGPLVVAPNHVTYFDPFWISAGIRRKVRYMAWDKIFELPVVDPIFRWLGAFPVNLQNPEFGTFKVALQILRQREALMVFPEGGRSPDGSLQPFKEGAARLALRTGAEVLPVAVHGGSAVWGPKLLLPRPRKVWVDYLPPISCPATGSSSKVEFERAASELTEAIRSSIESRLKRGPTQ